VIGLSKGTIKRIHVNQHNLRHRLTFPDDLRPVATVKVKGETITGDRVEIVSEGRVVATLVVSINKPLACGARVWIETSEEVVVREQGEAGE
jgi:hypothetical protein